MNPTAHEPLRITPLGLLATGLILFGAFLRLYNLDHMAFHHDESIHAYYSYKVYQGDLTAYKYDPTYHGPFLYHFGGLFFVLFGDSDFTARLPFVSLGVLLLYFVWRLRPWIGTAGAVCSLFLVACSPTLTYFSRFARNDIYMAAMAMGILLFALEYLRSRKTSHLAWMTLWLALMYCCKENSYMTGFVLGSFAVFYGLYHVFSHPREYRSHAYAEILQKRYPFVKILMLYGLFSIFAFTYVYYVTHRDEFRALVNEARPPGRDLAMGYLRTAWTGFAESHGSLFYYWLGGIALLGAAVFGAFWRIRRRHRLVESDMPFFRRFAANNYPVAICLLIVAAVYTALFSTLGTNRSGLQAGVIDYLLYWMGQQGDPRIPGPPNYFLPRLALYELLPVLAGAAAFLVYLFRGMGWVYFTAFLIAFVPSVYVYWHVVLLETENTGSMLLIWLICLCAATAVALGRKMVSLFSFVPANPEEDGGGEEKAFKPDGLRIFFIYWAVLSILIYAMLEEKVPWLLVHQALPLCLLAGTFMGDLWDNLRPGAARVAYGILVAFFALYQVRTDILLNFYNPDNPRETMVYVQTSHMIHLVLDDIKEAAERLGPEYMPPNPTKPIVALDGDNASWPYSWYLREYMTSPNYNLENSLPQRGVPFVICAPQYEDRMRVWARGEYTKRMIKHQEWWPYGQSELPFGYFSARNQPQSEAWKALLRYALYREKWSKTDPSIQPGSRDMLVYAKTPLIEPLEKPEVPKGYEEGPVPLEGLAMVGSLGAGEGQFNEPRGVALAPGGDKVYVLDGKNGRIQVFDRDLQYLTQFGGIGDGPGQFTVNQMGGPNGGISAGPDGTVYATDTWAGGTGRVNRYAADGTPLPPISRAGGESFFFPRGLATAPNGKLFVSDTGNNRIVWFQPGGDFGGIIAKGMVQEPVGITADGNGLLYVCDVKNQRVVSISQNGQFVRQWQILGWNVADELAIPWIEPYVTVDSRSYVYVTDSTGNTIHRFDQTGTEVVVAGGERYGPGALNKPKGIAVDGQGNLYIADSMNHRVIKARFRR